MSVSGTAEFARRAPFEYTSEERCGRPLEAYSSVELEGATLAQFSGRRVVYHFERGAITASELIGRLSARYRIRELEVRQTSIEDTIRKICEEELLAPDLDTGIE